MERVIRVSLAAQVNGFVNGMQQAEAAARKAKAGSEDATAAYERQKQAMNEVGVVISAASAVAVAATALSVRAAIDWESAWAGVTKTVDGSVSEMAALQDELRGLATNLPASHREIAAVAEAAGQLGVERENVTAFTKTMVDLGETTNLTADQAATSLAQLMNVMRTAPEDIERLGATLVALGNDGASTESEILEMAQRIAGAGKLIGATEGEVLGLANALASMGITAELGGGVASRILQDLYSAVQTGGEELQGFAVVAGVSAREFATQFRNDPVRALDVFAKGLNGVESSGGNVVQTLADLGFRSSEEQRVLLQLKGAGDLLTESLDLQAVAWEENTALADEAAKRYATTEAQLQVMQNRVNEAAIEFGDVFLPAMQAGAQVVGDLALGFAGLPQPIQTTVAWLTALVGVAGLAGGAFLLGVPKIAEFRLALATLSTSSMPAVASAATGLTTTISRTTSGFSAAARFMTGPWGLALAAAAVGVGVLQQQLDKLQASTEEMQNSVKLGSAADIFDSASQGLDVKYFRNVREDLENLRELLPEADARAKNFLLNLKDVGKTSSPVAGLNDALEKIGTELGTLAAEDAPSAAAAFQRIAQASGLSQAEMGMLLDRMPAYRDALQKQATDAGVLTAGMSDAERAQALLTLATKEAPPAAQSAGDAYQEQARKAKELQDALNQLIDVVLESNGVAQDAESANAKWHEELANIERDIEKQRDAYEKATGSAWGFTVSLDRNTEAGSANRAALSDVARAAEDAATKQRDQDNATLGAEESTRKFLDTLAAQRQAFIDTATEAGYNADEVRALADEIFAVPDSKSTEMIIHKAQAEDALRGFMTTLDQVPWQKEVRIQTTVAAAISQGLQLDGGRAGGGIIPGPPSNRDNRVYALATGEFVVKASQVAKPENRAVLEHMNAGGRIQGYRDGGYVTPQYMTGGGASVQSGAPIHLSVTVQPRPGMDENALADRVVNKTLFALGRR